jgi:hypothetical protein
MMCLEREREFLELIGPGYVEANFLPYVLSRIGLLLKMVLSEDQRLYSKYHFY